MAKYLSYRPDEWCDSKESICTNIHIAVLLQSRNQIPNKIYYGRELFICTRGTQTESYISIAHIYSLLLLLFFFSCVQHLFFSSFIIKQEPFFIFLVVVRKFEAKPNNANENSILDQHLENMHISGHLINIYIYFVRLCGSEFGETTDRPHKITRRRLCHVCGHSRTNLSDGSPGDTTQARPVVQYRNRKRKRERSHALNQINHIQQYAQQIKNQSNYVYFAERTK